MTLLVERPPLYEENALQHFGIKGMRWGVRKEESDTKSAKKESSSKSAKAKKVAYGVAAATLIAAGAVFAKRYIDANGSQQIPQTAFKPTPSVTRDALGSRSNPRPMPSKPAEVRDKAWIDKRLADLDASSRSKLQVDSTKSSSAQPKKAPQGLMPVRKEYKNPFAAGSPQRLERGKLNSQKRSLDSQIDAARREYYSLPDGAQSNYKRLGIQARITELNKRRNALGFEGE